MDVASATAFEKIANFQNVAGFANEGSGDKIDVLFNPENDIVGVLFRNARQGDGNSRHVNALLALDRSSVDDTGLDFSALNVNNRQSNQTVVDQDCGSYRNVARKI
ncbi:hypothetical protein D3C71_1291300 [compost metagenome]